MELSWRGMARFARGLGARFALEVWALTLEVSARSARLLAVAAVFTVGSPAAAWACHCGLERLKPPCEAAWTADAVFVGRVLDVTEVAPDRSKPESLFIQRLVRFAVVESFRGLQQAPGSVVEIRTGRGDGDCGYRFEVQREYLVYAHPYGGALTATVCSRTRPVTGAAGDLAYLRMVPRAPGVAGRLVGVATHADYGGDGGQSTPRVPVRGVRVVASTATITLAAVTGEDGRYEINAPVGTYDVRFEAPDGFYAPPESFSVQLRDARACASTNVLLRSNGVLTGYIVTWDGRPVPHLPIELVTPNRGDTPWRTRTDAEGRYTIEGISPGQFLLGVLPFGPRDRARRDALLPRAFFPGVMDHQGAHLIRLARAERLSLPTLTLPISETFATVTGTVVDVDLSPVPGAFVWLNPGEGPGSIGDYLKTDTAGRFSVTVKVGHEYVILVQAASRDAVVLRAESRIAVTDREPRSLVIKVRP